MRAIVDQSGAVVAPDAVLPSRTELLELLRVMRGAERLDARLVALRGQGRVGLFVPGRGEEGAVVGAVAALDFRDPVFPSGRAFGASLWRGASFSELVHAALGTARDPLKGRLTAGRGGLRDAHVHPAPAGVGRHLPIAVGAAIGLRLRGEARVAAALFGTAALGTPGFASALALAERWSASVVLVAITEQGEDCGRAAAAAEAFGVDGDVVDGDDVLAVQEAVGAAARRARDGGGPSLVEACCTLGSRAALERVLRFARNDGALDGDLDSGMLAGIEAEIEQAVIEAAGTPAPPTSAAFEGVLAEEGPALARARSAWDRFDGLYGGSDDPAGSFSY